MQDQMRKERVQQARGVLNSPVFGEIYEGLWNEQLETLVTAEPGSLQATSAHAMLKALRLFKRAMEAAVNDGKFIKG